MTPVEPVEHDRRWTDVSRLTFSPSIVVAIVVTAIAIAGAGWASNSGLRSDVRDILTRMESQAEVSKLNMELQKQRDETTRESLDAMKRRQELQAYEIQGLKEVVLTLKGRQ